MRKSKTSMRKLVLSGVVLACGMAGTAQAASTLGSGPVFGGKQQQIVACVVVNLGSTPITFLTEQLVGQFRAGSTPPFAMFGQQVDGASSASRARPPSSASPRVTAARSGSSAP